MRYEKLVGAKHASIANEQRRKKTLDLAVRHENEAMREAVLDYARQPLPIASGSYQTIERIVERFGALTDASNRPTCEMSGYLLGDNNGAHDVYVAKGQRVSPSYVDLDGSGVISSLLDIRRLYQGEHKNITIGWFHSHGDMEPFLSGTDKSSLRRITEDTGPIHDVPWGNDSSLRIAMAYALVVNRAKSTPYVACGVEHPWIKIDDTGAIVAVRQYTMVDDIGFKIIGSKIDETKLKPTAIIDRELKDRIAFMDERPTQSSTDAVPNDITTMYEHRIVSLEHEVERLRRRLSYFSSSVFGKHQNRRRKKRLRKRN